MKHKGVRRAAHILNEINLYLLEKNATRIVNEIIELPDKTAISAVGKVTLNEDELQLIKMALEAHHEYEYDQYWGLVGEGTHCDEIPILGSLIDYSEVEYNEGVLRIYCERKQ